jgi:hypothetical protein
VFPSGLPGGSIVLRVLLETCLRSEPGSAQEEVKPTNGSVFSWNCTGLSGRDLWKKHVEDESIEGNVQAMESNEGGD